MSFNNKVIWITGASSGIGEAMAKELARQGALLVLSARRVNRLERVQRHCERSEEHFILPMDVCRPETHAAALDAIIEKFGKLDIVVVNAGIGQRGTVLESGFEIDRKIMEINYFGSTTMVHTTLPYFEAQKSGHYVVISSIMGKIATPRRAMYSASKHALHGFFEALRAEVRSSNIDVTMLCAGYVRTEISRHALEASGKEHGEMDAQHVNAMLPRVFATKAVKAVQRKKAVSFIGGAERFAPWIERFSPSLYRFLLPRVITRD